jgi:preprotein translocase subunit SecY
MGGRSNCVYSLARRPPLAKGALNRRGDGAQEKRSANTMASAAEQLAANINWSAFTKADELKKRIWFTLGALVVYRLGTYIPLPGIDPNAFEQSFTGHSQGVLDMFNMFSGGAVQRMAVFALNIMPYISASIIIQLLSSVLPSLEAIKKEGEAGRKVLNQYTRYLTVILAVFQAYGIAIGLEGRAGVVSDTGLLFRFSTVVTLTGGTMFLVWLGEQITSRGVGNGSSLIIFAGIVARLPQAVAQLFELGRQGSISTGLVLAIIVMVFVVVTFIVFMERAQRRVPITYPRRQVGNKMYEGQSSFLPLKLNTAGVIPPIFASSLLLLPTTVANFAQSSGSSGFLSLVSTLLGRGGPLYIILYVALIVFFAFFYTATVFNPADTADNLKKHGGFVPGVRPGERTAQYIDQILTRITVLGAGYLALICILPELLTSYSSVQLYFGGTSLLIVVNVTMDTVAQIHGHLQAHQYEGLIRKAKLRGRKR